MNATILFNLDEIKTLQADQAVMHETIETINSDISMINSELHPHKLPTNHGF
jgi:hypothetical protein